MAWDKVSTVLAVTIIIFQMKRPKQRPEVIWEQGLQSFHCGSMKTLGNKVQIIYQPFSTQGYGIQVSWLQILASFHLTLVALGYHSMWERTGDESEKMWTTQQLVPLTVNRAECLDEGLMSQKAQPSTAKTSRRRSPSVRSTALCKLIKLLPLLAWICVFWHEQRRADPPQGVSFQFSQTY